MKRNRITGMMTAGLFAAGMIFSLPSFAREVHAEESNVTIQKTNIKIMFEKDTFARTSQDVTGPLDVKVSQYQEGVLTGTSKDGLARVLVDDQVMFADPASFVSSEEDIAALKEQQAEEKRKAEEEARRKEEEKKKAEEEARRKEEEAREAEERAKAGKVNWNGPVLSRSSGVNYGPSGKETYYNLPMQGVVNIMRGMGNQDAYWVREDGAKMLGNYIMVAANLSVHPRGSLVPTSMGMGIVCDTGGFAAANPTQLDIATAW